MLLRLILKSRWTVIVLSLIIAALLVLQGMTSCAGVLILLIFGLITAIRSHLEEKPLSKAFITGLCAGIAGLLWIWALIAYIPFLVIFLWPLRARTMKVFLSSLFGLATPWWIYLPYYLYNIIEAYNR